jgi:hypothetical protein
LIGVVRQNIENDSTWRLRRIAFPAIFLHGLFDFILFFWALLWNYIIHKENPDNNDHPSAVPDAIIIVEMLQSLLLRLPVHLIGVGYYYVEARKQ